MIFSDRVGDFSPGAAVNQRRERCQGASEAGERANLKYDAKRRRQAACCERITPRVDCKPLSTT